MFRKNQTAINPIARTEGLSVTTSGDETLVYDREQFVIHRLSADVAAAWRLADGTRDVQTIAMETGAKAHEIEQSLQSLQAMGLVQLEQVGGSRLSRRLLVGGAAGAAAGSFIPASAASCVSQSCQESYSRWLWVRGTTQCPSGQCCGNLVGKITGITYPISTCVGGMAFARMMSLDTSEYDAAEEAAYKKQQGGGTSENVAPPASDENIDNGNGAPEGGQGDQSAPEPPADSYNMNDTSFDQPVETGN